ncbi:TDRD1_4_6_7 [Mytilus edulis]|uniref:TDRD1_4_6_7 n=1 Tax=Mytilus edulis TaxID=6550 RepID=A0A8S3RM41_MYTED|nr:TDRD1_4_6_7 [Mytilus edulis]
MHGNDIVLALYRKDENWYRAKVLSTNDNLSLVFIDYGNSEVVDISDARLAPTELNNILVWSVIKSAQNDNVLVLVVDFGFEELVSNSQVREISPRSMPIPSQALECTVDSTLSKKKHWSEKEIDFLSEFENFSFPLFEVQLTSHPNNEEYQKLKGQPSVPVNSKTSNVKSCFKYKVSLLKNLVEVLFIDYGNTECQERDGLKIVQQNI